MNPKTLCSPVLLCLLLLSGAGRAQEPSPEPDERLVEGSAPDGLTQHHQLSGSLDFWDEYPPTIEEYNRVRTR